MKSLEAPLESEDDTLKKNKAGHAGPSINPRPVSPGGKADKRSASRKDLGNYTIRVGVCVLPEELRRAESQIRSLGLSPSSVRGRNKVGMHKVLVGPYPTREKAGRIRHRLYARHVKGNVTAFEGGYYIRVGAFYKKDSALRMRDRMKKMGYSSRPLFQPTEISCHVLFATGRGDPAAAREKVNLLRKKGFKAAAIVRK